METKSKEQIEAGRLKIDWSAQAMPVLMGIRESFSKEQPLAGQRVSACLHVTAETANLVRTLAAGGAVVSLCASNPQSTQDDVAAALSSEPGIDVFAVRGADRETYFEHINAALASRPTITIDDGADLTNLVHTQRAELLEDILGGTEETTSGVTRLASMAASGKLKYPVIAVNNAMTKHLFDNRYGTGQSAVDGIMRATNRLICGSCFVVAGYGWCGRGLAMRAAGMGARVVVTEVDEMRALEATMDGYQVLPMDDAAKLGDFFCTVTGNIDVIHERHFASLKDGAMICNAGHFDVEIDMRTLERVVDRKTRIRENLEEYRMEDGRRIYVLGQGRLVNLAAAEGHPGEVMDLSFANQALCAGFIAKQQKHLEPRVHDVPTEIDQNIAALKLSSLGIEIDALTEKQQQYLESWNTGT